ncbi:MAG TPA: hypothetical protein VIJ75_19260 [Hanamia sp.]
MNKNRHIRKSLAIVLLAIFALSNTPTKYLHKLFANHVDFVNKTLTNSKTPQLNASGINCHCESNVVIAPYTIANVFSIKPIVTVFSESFIATSYQIHYCHLISFGLRGPPVVV